ncbi:bifunctional acetate--CoA ligase family protein/GNAT family N-acetyltransferase [Nitrospira sp. Kam-Ns4a]
MTATRVRPLYIPLLSPAEAERGHLVLRDGTTALIRPARPEDQPALQAFVDRLSPQSRSQRFFSESQPPAELLAALCRNDDPRASLTLLVTRVLDGEPAVIAAGSYLARSETTAEVALAVDDAFHGKGLGTLLLERLAVLAARHGFQRLWAVTHAENLAMREVFRQSGFEIRETIEGGEMEVELSAIPSAESVGRSETRERVATTASLRPFFKPRAVAVIGASREPRSLGGRLLRALLAEPFQGPVYPVNPKATEIAGLRAYPSARALPEPVDLAVVAVPRDAVAAAVADCAARGVRALVVITAGFAETGPEGRARQDRLVEQVRGAGMRLIGPNCMGILNTDPAVRLNATFSPVFPPPGRVAMLTQSGALGLAILAAARRLRLGLSTFVSVGNKADVSGNDLLQYWEEDPATDVILLYLESFGNPRRFARIARRVSRRKPIVAVKGGRSQVGSRAAGSHTAALAASDAAVDALFRQTGVIRADTLEDMFGLAAALASQPLPTGRRAAIVTNAGGPGILCADACEAGGLTLPRLSDQTRAALAAFLPPTASVTNPVDLIASAGPADYQRAIEILLASDEADALIVIYIPLDPGDVQAVARAIRDGVAAGRAARPAATAPAPVLLCWMGEVPDWDSRERAPDALAEAHLPCYAFPEAPARVLGRMAAYAEWQAQPLGMMPDFDDLDWAAARETCRRALEQRGAGWLAAEETRTVLAAVRAPLPPGGVATTADEAAALARRIGFPVALKLASRMLVHKTEIGGVRLHLTDEAAVRRAFEDLRDRLARDGRLDVMDGVLVQPMVSGGVEVMMGVVQDPLFGPLIAFGLGGIHVEILGDVAFRVTPLTDRDASEMVRSIKGFRLLEGYRGHPPADVAAIEELLLRLSRLVEELPEIVELDLNPVFALPPGRGCCIADARIKVAPPGGTR